jgi:hypothetical protein
MSRFIVADISDPSSIPQELQAIVPHVETAVQPLIETGLRPYAMFSDFGKYPWVLKIHEYSDATALVKSLSDDVITPAEAKVEELTRMRKLRA